MRRESMRASDEIVSALNERRITIAFEPVVATSTRKTAFYECLMRVQRADGTLVTAHDIIPIAERLGLVRLLDHRVLELLVSELIAAPDLHASLNVSPASTFDPDWWAGLDRLPAGACGRRRTADHRDHRDRRDPGHRRHPRLRRPRQGSRLPHRDRRFRRRLYVVPQPAQARRRHGQDRRRLRAEPHPLGGRPRLRAHAGRPRPAARARRSWPNGCRTRSRRRCSPTGAAIICRAR